MLILHGDNLVISRKFLNERIKLFPKEIVKLEGDKIALGDLKQAIESSTLFGKERLVVVFNLFSCRSSKTKDSLLEYCKIEIPKNLIIWENKKIDGRKLASFSGAEIRLFNLLPLIFKFLESCSPKNRKESLVLLHQCLTREAPEIIFYLFVRQVKDLIIAADLGKPGLDSMPDWKKNKLIIQANKFGRERLIKLYRQLLIIDYQQKTGKTLLPLTAVLDLLIASF